MTEFSRTTRTGGVVRTIALLHAPGRTAVVVVAHWHEGESVGRIMIFRENVEVVLRACEVARDPASRGRTDTGKIATTDGLEIHVWARVDAQGARVCFARVRLTGERLGSPTTIADDEIDALANALKTLMETTKTP